MTLEVPIFRHLDLYSYWLSKRNGRLMPARWDMDPVELGRLLPFLVVVDKPACEFRYRLMGTGVVQDLGRDLTGKPFNVYVGNSPQTIAAAHALHEHVFADAQPVFVTSRRATAHGAIRNNSAVLLPLADDGRHVNMFIASRIACHNSDAGVRRDWPGGAHLKLLDTIDIHHASDLERRCLDWKGGCLASRW